jgi:hypothetical protein
VGTIDLSLCKVERADFSFAATLLSELGNAARLQQHVIDEIEPRHCIFRLVSGQQDSINSCETSRPNSEGTHPSTT